MSVPHHRLALGAVAALALAGAAVVAAAQPPPPAPPPSAPAMERPTQFRGHPGEFRHGPRRGERMAMRHRDPEARAERLRTLLQLTPNQDGALKTYLAAVAPPEPGAFMQRMGDNTTPPTAVQRADRAAAMAGRIAAEARTRADATRAFYAALTPSQRKVFDTMPRAGGPMAMRIHNMRGRPPIPPMPRVPG